MENGDLSLFGFGLISLSAIGAWLTGETGRIMVAGGLGGLTRWLAAEKRRLRDGVIAIVGGVITGMYMWPLGLHAPRMIGSEPFPPDEANIALSAFLVGTMGVSAVKIITAYVEARANKVTGDKADE